MKIGILLLFCETATSMFITPYEDAKEELHQYFLDFRQLKTAKENFIRGLNQEERAILCESIFDSRYYKVRQLELANKTKEEVRNKLAEEYSASYELHYFRQSELAPPIPIQPAFEMSIQFEDSVMREIVTPCLGVRRKSSADQMIEIFISDGYKDNTLFVHLRNRLSRKIWFRAMAEEDGEVVLTFKDRNELEKYYVHLREKSRKTISERSPLSSLSENQLRRIAGTVFGAVYFRRTKEMRLKEEDVSYEVQNRRVLFSDTRWDRDSLYAEVLPCKVTFNNSRETKDFYIGWGFHAMDRSVFIFQNSPSRTGISLAYYVINVPVFLKPAIPN